MKRVHIIVTGLVQGVGFRHYTRKEAEVLKITGFVRNLSDGSVEIEAQGTEDHIQSFINWAKKGPRNARVDSFHENDMRIVERETDFNIMSS